MSNWQNNVTPLNENNMRALYDLRAGDTNIQANTDLNNLTTVGSYKCTSSSVLATLLNLPDGVSSTFKLIVENISGSTNYRQTMHVNGNYALTYIRSYGGSTWGEWIKRSDGNVRTGSLTYNSTYVSENPDINLYAKNGNVVQISFRAKLVDNIPDNTTLITLPYKSAIASEVVAYKGTQYIRETAHFAYTSSNNNYIKIGAWSGTNKYIHLLHTYITNED